ncbi:unnamed protein product [Lupinus luteus]|uniref:Uncharacterized protein n=1 Tax=Lupinus luteus TaxID=3873 RepID=A0AAV1WYK0_LUPLU
MGTAFLLFTSYQVTHNANDLTLCSQIVKSCDPDSIDSRDVTFICGRAGVYALGPVAAKHGDDGDSMRYYLSQFEKVCKY